MIKRVVPKYIQIMLVFTLCSPWCFADKPLVSILSASEYAHLKKSFYQLLEGRFPPAVEDWQAMGMALTEDDDNIYIEADQVSKFGLGKATLKKYSISTEMPLMLQVPHQFYDRHTGDIGRALFAEEGFRVYMENTVQRYSADQTDFARLERSIFSAFAAAYIERYPQGRVVQIHGFSSAKRKTRAGRFADIIISNGSLFPDQKLLAVQACLRRQLKLVTRVFGLDVFELGATTNATGLLLNRQDIGRFLHIELSEKIRQHHADIAWLEEMKQCL